MDGQPDDREPPKAPEHTPASRRISSRELLRGAHELVIDHRGQEYRLRLTKNDKLILNK